MPEKSSYRIIVNGADGYIGWPLAQELIRRGHNVMGIDAGFRRNYYSAFECIKSNDDDQSIVPIASLDERKSIISNYQKIWNVDICDAHVLTQAINAFSPDVIVHLAEISSRPYFSEPETSLLGIKNNITSMLTTLLSVRSAKPATQIIKASSIDAAFVPHDLCSSIIKSADDLVRVSCEAHKLRATVLHLGLVYGLQKGLSADMKRTTRFDYCYEFGNVVHRFICQGLSEKRIVVYGDGKQQIPIIHIRDAVRSFVKIIEKPQISSEIFRRQFACCEYRSVISIANTVNRGLEMSEFPKADIVTINNPRGNELRETSDIADRHERISFSPETVKMIIDDIRPWIHSIDKKAIAVREASWASRR